MKILFIGCVELSWKLLNALICNKKNVCGVITQSSNSENSDFKDLTELCVKNGIPYLYSKDGNDADSISFAKQLSPDIIYCMGWSRLLKEGILSTAKFGGIGFHPAKLPANKGRHPIIWALVLGLEKTAISFFRMSLLADSGEIVYQEDINIEYEDDARSLYDKIMNRAIEGVLYITQKFESGNISQPKIALAKTENENIWRKRSYKDGMIDWRMTSQAIYNLVRGLTHPYVGADMSAHGKEIKVWKVEEYITGGIKNVEYGKVVKVVSDTDFYIKAYDNLIHVIDCEPVKLVEGEYL